MTILKESKREKSLPKPDELMESWAKNSPLTKNICDVYVAFSCSQSKEDQYRLSSYFFTSFDLKGEVVMEFTSLSELNIMQYLREVKKGIQNLLIQRREKEEEFKRRVG